MVINLIASIALLILAISHFTNTFLNVKTKKNKSGLSRKQRKYLKLKKEFEVDQDKKEN